MTPCDKEAPNSGEMESLCTEAGIDNNLVRYAWEIALPESSNFVRIQDVTPWTDPKSKVLDSIYFKVKVATQYHKLTLKFSQSAKYVVSLKPTHLRERLVHH